MVFWRKKKNQAEQEREEKEDKIIHHSNDPALEPETGYDPEIDRDFKDHALQETETEILDELETVPTPLHSLEDDKKETEELSDDSKEGGWFSRLTGGLSKSSSRLGQGIADIFTKKKLDQQALDDLEDLLITSDLGPATAKKLIDALSKEKFEKDVSEPEIKEFLSDHLAEILAPVAQKLEIQKSESGPFVILVCGVNGVGKTTTIGKIAHQLHYQEKHSVMLAAGDTFRAAAIEQLEIWGQRIHCPVLSKDIGADAASVAYEAYEKAKSENIDVLMIDTAGRLHNKANLMAELEKIIRVLKKQDENLPHSCLLILDATTGQNAHAQLKIFKEIVDVSGLVVTKLDGSAKGGVVVSLAQEFGLPIHAIGVGEQVEDLNPFTAKDFANALLGIEN